MHFELMLKLELGGTAQRLAQNLRLVAKLRRVVHVLVITTAAIAEV